LMLWIICHLTHQEIRDRLQDPDGIFQKKLIEYLESVQVGEFLTGTKEQVFERCDAEVEFYGDLYKNPVETLPIPPPQRCSMNCGICDLCQSYNTWSTYYLTTVDDLLSKSNQYTGCMDNKYGKCRARFPRPVVERSHLDPETGGLVLKKKEPWINTVTPVLTYLLRCNTDVTSLKSGTATDEIVEYTSKYATKSGLKTRVM
ncbi:hypothetical protein BDN72DRAFT_741392, partial [Pluteus cervinus]